MSVFGHRASYTAQHTSPLHRERLRAVSFRAIAYHNARAMRGPVLAERMLRAAYAVCGTEIESSAMGCAVLESTGCYACAVRCPALRRTPQETSPRSLPAPNRPSHVNVNVDGSLTRLARQAQSDAPAHVVGPPRFESVEHARPRWNSQADASILASSHPAAAADDRRAAQRGCSGLNARAKDGGEVGNGGDVSASGNNGLGEKKLGLSSAPAR
eukprot:3940605-Rhodomonas_salina.1